MYISHSQENKCGIVQLDIFVTYKELESNIIQGIAIVASIFQCL